MAYDNNNSGFLARNDNRSSEKHPEFKGAATVGGAEYWVSGWVRQGKPGSKMAGKNFFSLSFTPKEERPAPRQKPQPQKDEFSDDIPF